MHDRPLKVLTWHVHGNYLWYLSETPCEFYLPVAAGTENWGHGYSGRAQTFPFGSNVIDCPVERIKEERFDLILFQSRRHYEEDQLRLLSAEQRRLPCVYIEHDPPWEDVTDQPHWFNETNGLLVHVTHYNRLMWDSGQANARVIEHGVKVPAHARYTGELSRGITALNHLQRRAAQGRGRCVSRAGKSDAHRPGGHGCGRDGWTGRSRTDTAGGFHVQVSLFLQPHSFTSLGLAILEAMTVGLPVVGLATCELATVIENGRSGYLETDLSRLLGHMQRLSEDREEAAYLGRRAREIALERFNIRRFARDWHNTLWEVGGDNIARGATSRSRTHANQPTPQRSVSG